MSGDGLTLFDTAVGRCGIAWRAGGIAAVQLPEGRDEATRARLLRRVPGAAQVEAPPEVRRTIDAIVALLRGEPNDLRAAALDMTGVPPFNQRVYEIARRIPVGATLSYGEVAARVGSRGAARAVGQALGQNPFAIVVPCHRVVSAGGRAGGFSARGGVDTKLRLLSLERGQAPLVLTGC